ncbi:DUF2752 domain-containing protein [uncultured Maribacter sp.]|uniref:DUF2752 domain-containing protein n=1 Tax=uncultured Maribacter sp. TaxID=431308 RepID=UPI0026246175|nr:DUF2752 domain-containing protein [uncultured Maribacter sp.]
MKLLITILLFSLDEFMLPCITKKFIGIDCPGCGLQRSLALLLQGDFLAAFIMYPPVYSIIALLIFLLVRNFITIKYANKIIVTLTITAIGFILINYILKFI